MSFLKRCEERRSEAIAAERFIDAQSVKRADVLREHASYRANEALAAYRLPREGSADLLDDRVEPLCHRRSVPGLYEPGLNGEGAPLNGEDRLGVGNVGALDREHGPQTPNAGTQAPAAASKAPLLTVARSASLGGSPKTAGFIEMPGRHPTATCGCHPSPCSFERGDRR